MGKKFSWQSPEKNIGFEMTAYTCQCVYGLIAQKHPYTAYNQQET